jgi:hypothetical protein
MLLSSCQGLITLQGDSGTLQLAHYTAQTYLETKFPRFEVNTCIARTCLLYLQLEVFSDVRPNEDMKKLMSRYPLSGYAASYWADHARHGRAEELEQIILTTLRERPKRVLFEQVESLHRNLAPIGGEPLSLLQLVAMHGFHNVCLTILNSNEMYLSI